MPQEQRKKYIGIALNKSERLDVLINELFELTKMDSPNFTAEKIGALYHLPPVKIAIKPFDRILTVKVVLPRLHGSGSPLDTDVYGSQQHFPLGDLEI